MNEGAAPNRLPTLELGPKPSIAYEQAKNSPVYRLSELMFGSLLASYVLGFIAFFAVHAPELVKHFTKEELVESLPYLFISFTFAYLTAGFYISYNAGILTMPHMPLENLRFDFLLALSQAIAFGLSMLFPMATWFCLGFALVFALMRQHAEYNRLAARCRSKYGKPIVVEDRGDQNAAEKKARRKFERDLDNLLKKSTELTGWRDTRMILWLGAIGLTAIGAAVGTIIWVIRSHQPGPGLAFRLSLCIAIITFMAALVTFWRVHQILKDRAVFLYKGATEETIKMDIQYLTLLEHLRAYGESNS